MTREDDGEREYNLKEDIRMKKRLLKILETLIKISEKKGVNVQPHHSLQKGELLRNIKVNYMVDDINDYTKKIVERSIIVEADSSMTVWEFKD